MKYCTNCGAELEKEAVFCKECGARIKQFGNETQEEQLKFQMGMRVVENICAKEWISFWIWIVIACIQVLIGFTLTSAWGAALWNFFVCASIYQYIKKIQAYPVGIYTHYSDSLFSIILFIGINLFAGGVIGIVGCIYDLTIRSYVMGNKEVLFYVEVVYSQGKR